MLFKFAPDRLNGDQNNSHSDVESSDQSSDSLCEMLPELPEQLFPFFDEDYLDTPTAELLRYQNILKNICEHGTIVTKLKNGATEQTPLTEAQLKCIRERYQFLEAEISQRGLNLQDVPLPSPRKK